MVWPSHTVIHANQSLQVRGNPPTYSTNLPLSTHLEVGSPIPTIILEVAIFSWGKAFLIIFDPLSSIWIFLSCNSFILSTSQIKWYANSTCFVCECNPEFLLRWIAILLSHIEYNSFVHCSTLLGTFSSKDLLAGFIAIYSASVLDRAMRFCNFGCRDSAPPIKGTRYPDIDFL